MMDKGRSPECIIMKEITYLGAVLKDFSISRPVSMSATDQFEAEKKYF